MTTDKTHKSRQTLFSDTDTVSAFIPNRTEHEKQQKHKQSANNGYFTVAIVHIQSHYISSHHHHTTPHSLHIIILI